MYPVLIYITFSPLFNAISSTVAYPITTKLSITISTSRHRKAVSKLLIYPTMAYATVISRDITSKLCLDSLTFLEYPAPIINLICHSPVPSHQDPVVCCEAGKQCAAASLVAPSKLAGVILDWRDARHHSGVPGWQQGDMVGYMHNNGKGQRNLVI